MEKSEERTKLVEREIKLLAEIGKLFNGYSKAFRKMFYEIELPDRVAWFEEVYREALFEKAQGAI